MSKETIIITVIAIVFALGIGLMIWKSPSPTDTTVAKDKTILVRAGNEMTGKIGAKATLVEFGDYECPACAQTSPLLKEVADKYKSNPDFNFVFRNFPLTTIHPNAMISAQAAEAAGLQSKFWEMHDMLYAKQGDWANSSDPLPIFAGYATKLGLDVNKFKTDITSKVVADAIAADQADDTALALDHTPTVYLNGVTVANPDDVKALEASIDAILAK